MASDFFYFVRATARKLHLAANAIRCGVLIVAFGVCASANAALIGVTFSGQAYQIDEATGNGVLIGSVPSGLNSLSADATGLLFSATGSVVTLNPTTLGVTVGPTIDLGGVVRAVRGAAVSPAGTLFVVNNRGLGLNPDDLYTIDTTSGVGTLVGQTPLTGLQALTFNPDGSLLYAWDRGTTILNQGLGLVTIDPSTGSFTDVSAGLGGLTNIQSLAFGADGNLYGGSQNGELYRIDPTTAGQVLVGSGSYTDLRGLAQLTIPEPSSACLFALIFIGGLTWAKRPAPQCVSV